MADVTVDVTVGADVASAVAVVTVDGSQTTIDESWDAMIASLTFTPPNYLANCDTIDAWYQAHTGYDTNGVVEADLVYGDLDARGQSGTQANPIVIEGIRGGPARWDGNWITFRHCLIENTGAYAAYADPTFGNDWYGIRFENCTFKKDPPVDKDCAIIRAPGGPGDYFGVSFIECDIQGFGGGLKAEGGLYARYCYIHDMQKSSVGGQHVTCSTARKSRHHMIRCLGTDGGSGMFNIYHESVIDDLLFEECIMIGMSPESSSSYGIDNAKGSLGFAANATNIRFVGCMCGRIAPTPFDLNPLTRYDGIQYGAFSGTTDLEYVKTGCFMIEDGSSF